MIAGTIQKLIADRGFGFIKGEDGRQYFFHRSSVEGSFHDLQEGDAVAFEPHPDSAKGPRAERVAVSEVAA